MAAAGTLIKGGYVIDPSNKRQGKMDVQIRGSKILKVAQNIAPIDGEEVINAEGMLVCPGLIDLHIHCYQYATPLGVHPDETCLKKGDELFEGEILSVKKSAKMTHHFKTCVLYPNF